MDIYLDEETEYNWLETVTTTIELCNYFPEENHLLKKVIQNLTDHFKNLKDQKVQETFLDFYKDIFLAMLKNNNCNPDENSFISIIISFLQIFIFSGHYDLDLKNSKFNFDFIIEEFDKICLILKSKYENVIIELFQLIVNNIYLFNPKTLLVNLYFFLVNLDIDSINKIILTKFYNYLDSPIEKKPLVSLLIENLPQILEFTEKSDNEDTVLLFWNSFIKFEEFLFLNKSSWRDTVNFVSALMK